MNLLNRENNNMTKINFYKETPKYVNFVKVKENCSDENYYGIQYSYEDQNINLTMPWVVIIPIFYVITTLLLIIYYCKFRRLNSTYGRVRQDVEMTNGSSRYNQGIYQDSYDIEDLEAETI